VNWSRTSATTDPRRPDGAEKSDQAGPSRPPGKLKEKWAKPPPKEERTQGTRPEGVKKGATLQLEEFFLVKQKREKTGRVSF